MQANLIAPCGFNCAVCAQYQKKKNPCPGCRELPCRRLRSFDERYRRISAGRLSVVENLRFLEREGMERFLAYERTRWTCPACGAVLCVGSQTCPACGRSFPDT